MKKFLLTIIIVEGLALFTLAGAALFAGEALAATPPSPPVFESPLADAVMGEQVEYVIRDLATGKMRGSISYKILRAYDVRGANFGRRFVIRIEEAGAGGENRNSRLVEFDARAGFLYPPRLEDAPGLPSGQKPVLSSLKSTKAKLGQAMVPAFVIEAVWPEFSLHDVKDRLVVSARVPVFGIVRRESVGIGEEWVLSFKSWGPKK